MADPVSPMPDDPNDVGADAPGTDDQGTEDQGTEQSKVLLTVLDNGDGSFTLVAGDEDSPGVAADDAVNGQEPQGQSFDSIGALMKGVLDILQKHEAGGDGTEDDNLDAGYSGAPTGAPTVKQPPAMMRS